MGGDCRRGIYREQYQVCGARKELREIQFNSIQTLKGETSRICEQWRLRTMYLSGKKQGQLWSIVTVSFYRSGVLYYRLDM